MASFTALDVLGMPSTAEAKSVVRYGSPIFFAPMLRPVLLDCILPKSV